MGKELNEKQLELARLLETLEKHSQRATYVAVAGVLGLTARSVMQGQIKNPRNSWVVSSESHLPTGYTKEQRHSHLEAKTEVISTKDELADWWKVHR